MLRYEAHQVPAAYSESFLKEWQPRGDDERALKGAIFVLRTGILWEELNSQEPGCGSGMNCWKRRQDWQIAGARQSQTRIAPSVRSIRVIC